MDIVVHGNTHVMMDEDGTDPFAIPKERGIFKAISSGSSITTADIVERIINHRFVDLVLYRSLIIQTSRYQYQYCKGSTVDFCALFTFYFPFPTYSKALCCVIDSSFPCE